MLTKLKLFYRRSKLLSSFRSRIFILLFLFGLVPCLILPRAIVASYEARAVDQRISDAGTQMRVLANHLIKYDFFSNPNIDTVNAELDLFSTLNDGRVLVVDSHLRVVRDSYDVATGKTIISRNVIKCLRTGKNGATSTYDKDNGYIQIITPISETASLEHMDYLSAANTDEVVRGVLVTSVSTDSIMATVEVLNRVAGLVVVVLMLLDFALALILSGLLVRPFGRLTQHISDVREGRSSELVAEPAYYETQQIVSAFNRVLVRMRTLDESREEFVSNVSHELKTPMASMKVLADSLLSSDNVPPEMYREFLQDITVEIDRENNIIKDLLSLVKMDEQAVRMDIAEVDIVELCETICKRVRPLALKRDIEVMLVSERPVRADIDETKMTLTLTNIIENAVKYNKEHGSVKVTVDADHQNFTIVVADTGIGIPADSIDKIYERFYRVDKSHSREIGGTGLGLAIAKNAINLHHGKIDVKSTLGEGTTFTITIPLHYIVEGSKKGTRALTAVPAPAAPAQTASSAAAQAKTARPDIAPDQPETSSESAAAPARTVEEKDPDGK